MTTKLREVQVAILREMIDFCSLQGNPYANQLIVVETFKSMLGKKYYGISSPDRFNYPYIRDVSLAYQEVVEKSLFGLDVDYDRLVESLKEIDRLNEFLRGIEDKKEPSMMAEELDKISDKIIKVINKKLDAELEDSKK